MNGIFNAFIIAIIIANTIVLFLDRYPMDQTEKDRQELSNTVFYGIFIFELLIKLVAFGPKQYVKDKFNIFDMLVISLSTADIIISSIDTASLGRALVGFRALRFLRIFKIARKWKSLQVTIT